MLQNLPFPSLKAYAELVRAFQRSFWPQTGKLWSGQHTSSAQQGFRFATGLSQKTPLSKAVVDCVDQIQQKLGLGVHPDFCQLFVTVNPHGNHIAYAPKYVQEIFSTYGLKPPVLIGGAVEGLIGDFGRPRYEEDENDEPDEMHDKGVSLMAAVLPGTRLHPFWTGTSSLPDIDWSSLLGNPNSETQKRKAAVLLAEPSFHQVKEFAERLSSTMPDMPILGGVVRGNAWGQEYGRERSLRGAVFLNDSTFESGAVGCILSGDLKVDAMCTLGCRAIGPPLRVTKLEEVGGQKLILELDGKEAFNAVAEVHNQHLRPASHPVDFQIWLDVAGSGHAFIPVVPKMSSSKDGSRYINVGNAEVGLGSLLQVHIRDGIVSQIELEHQFQWWLETVPEDDAREMGLLLYSCNQICHDEGGSIEDILCDPIPSLTYQGCKVDGEFAYIPPGDMDKYTYNQTAGEKGGTGILTTHCSTIGILRHDDTSPPVKTDEK